MTHDHKHHRHDQAHDYAATSLIKFSDFIPLIVIFTMIILFTWIMQARTPGADIMFAMRNFMGAFFVVFGGFKVLNWKGFADAYQMYDIVARHSRAYAYAYPLIELILGAAYLTGFALLVSNWITLIIMVISGVGVTKELLKGNKIICACLGTVFKIPMTKVTLFEDVLMAVMAAIMIML
jgi:uncharacterized membrane protein YphA (DoxX/SURF4 family)